MSGNSKVTPTDVILSSTKLSSSSAPQESTNSDKELQYLMNYVNSKKCYHSSGVENANVVNRQQKIAFQVQIWTLMEKRSVVLKEQAFDNRPTPGEDLEDMFNDKYAYAASETVVSEKTRGSIDLLNTRKKVICPSCQGKGLKPCLLCNESGVKLGKPCLMCNGQGSSVCTRCSKVGHVVQWNKLTVEWNTVYSVTYPRNTFLPDSCIHKTEGKLKTSESTTPAQNGMFCRYSATQASQTRAPTQKSV
ncbi:unnamed protein product [Didymodactylos carnosus]|uniref:Uncharacterized protein n=1 Tax=Didymodactylos carnosus TaxID=1234261 RepID=A0A815CDC9_9BILA|nr:unnamed protein product [Didymodactylos carnosus]CAF1281341.1 unnamed protein product [Didymodactylos carnosus]CAF3736148.1 unnamed protein product [Didymodactylos carnosus]CAF4077067.1 unnamed protein product [Didymodactylos carnosus]